MPSQKVLTRSALSEALFEVHSTAMDAANDPSRETINAMRKAYRKAERLLPAFYASELSDLRERRALDAEKGD